MDTFKLEFSQNDKLKAALGNLKPGDEFEFKVTGMVKALTPDALEGSLTRIEIEGEEPEEIEPSGDEPASVVMKMGKGKPMEMME